MIDIIKNNIAWTLTGAVLVLVVVNVYVSINQHNVSHADEDHPHSPIIQRFLDNNNNKNNNESELECPYISIP